MGNTDRMSMLERWADGMEKLEQYYEGKYGPPATPAQLPPITTYDAMLEAIADGMERAKRNINKTSPTYHSDSVAYVKTVPSGDVHYASLEQIGGKTIVWSQTFGLSMLRGDSTSYGVTSERTDKGIRLHGAFTSGVNMPVINGWYDAVVGHKYLITNTPVPERLFLRLTQNGEYANWQENTPFTATDTHTYLAIRPLTAGLNVDFDVTWTPLIFDLTSIFGEGNEPSTYEEFQQMFPAVWYAYNPGSLLSAGVTSVISKKADTTELATYPIPAEVRALSGYGWSCPSHYNYIDFEAKKFVQEVGNRAYASGDESDATVITDGTTTYYPLNPAVETDISAYLADDGLIEVEVGGTLEFQNQNGNDYRIPVPSSETFVVGEP